MNYFSLKNIKHIINMSFKYIFELYEGSKTYGVENPSKHIKKF